MATTSRPPEIDIARVRRYCQRRVPPHAREQVRLESVVRGSAITIIERRAPWRDDLGPEWSRLKVAQLRYDHGAWTLHWADRNGRWFGIQTWTPRLAWTTSSPRSIATPPAPSGAEPTPSGSTQAMPVGPNGLAVTRSPPAGPKPAPGRGRKRSDTVRVHRSGTLGCRPGAWPKLYAV